mgnify:FL=1
MINNTCDKCKKDYLSFTSKIFGLCGDCKVKKIIKITHLDDIFCGDKGLTVREVLDKAYKLHGGQENFDSMFQGRERTRELVRIRDNHTCQNSLCGKIWKQDKRKKNNRRFDIHHLNGNCGKFSRTYDRMSDIDELITLCHKCHLNLEEVKSKMSEKSSPRPDSQKLYQSEWERMNRHWSKKL